MNNVVIMFGKSKKPYRKIDEIFKRIRSHVEKNIASGQNVDFNKAILKQLNGLETHLLLVSIGQTEYDEVRHLLFVFVLTHCGGRFVDANVAGRGIANAENT